MSCSGSLLSGHAANQAILEQSQATDQWAYFQAKSTKQHIYEADKSVVAALAQLQGVDPARLDEQLKAFQQEVDRYKGEKACFRSTRSGICRFWRVYRPAKERLCSNEVCEASGKYLSAWTLSRFTPAREGT